MNDSFDITLLSSGALIKKGYSSVIANVGKTVAVITLVIATLLSFTEIGFSDAGAESFTSTLIMMLIASYVIYFSLVDAGERLGRDGEDYKNAVKAYEDKRRHVSGEDIIKLRKFCFDYQSEELEYRKSSLLLSLGYTKEEYEEFQNGSYPSRSVKRKFKKIERLKRASVTATDLLNKSGVKSGSDLKRPGMEKLIYLMYRLIPSTVCTFFTASMMISAKEGLTFSSIMESILKLSTLPIIGLKGYTAGYEYTVGSELTWINVKTDLLDAFIKQRA